MKRLAGFLIFWVTGCVAGLPGEDVYRGACPEDLDCSLPGTALVFSVRSERPDFFNRPWPADPRLTGEGTLDLTHFPNPGPSSVLQDWLSTVEATTRGFGTNAAIYLGFNGPLDPGSLPVDPAGTLTGEDVFLVDLELGERIPLAIRFFPDQRQFTPRNTLVLRPALGFSLRSSTRYAAVVSRGVLDPNGHPLGAVADFERTKYRTEPENQAVRAWWEVYRPAWDALERLGLARRGDVAALAVFTTQEIEGELDRVAGFIQDRPAPRATGWRRLADKPDAYRFEAWYPNPEFQSGTPPFLDEGGAFVFGADGAPVPQREPEIPFTLAAPRQEPPVGGFPVVLYAHGTGGTRNGFCDGSDDVCDLLAQDGIASIGIDQPLHGDRQVPGQDPSMVTFNYLNIEAMRDNFRQGAADLLVLRRLLEELEVPAELSPFGRAFGFDPQRVAFMGHSQGGITGPIFLGAARGIRGAMLSSSGGGLNVVLLERKDPLDLRALIVAGMMLEDEEFDLDHPVLNVFQAFAERADQLNYARRLIREPGPGQVPLHLLFSEGLQDPMTMPIQIENLAAASGCAIMRPVHQQSDAMRLYGIDPVDAPVSGNARGPDGQPVTAVLIQYPEDGHFPVFRNPDARRHYTGFLNTLLHDEVPTVGP